MQHLEEREKLAQIIARFSPTTLRPVAFFLARYGVLTLVYEGFSATLLSIKGAIEKEIVGLEGENPGSIWPKTTLGAIKNRRRLTLHEIELLHDLCTTWGKKLVTEVPLLRIDALTLVGFSCRSLEICRYRHPCPLRGTSLSEDPPPAWHISRVERILQQFIPENLERYRSQVNRVGYGEWHYRDEHQEETLVHMLPTPPCTIVEGFIEAVEKILPGYYTWFAPESRHITLRSLERVGS